MAGDVANELDLRLLQTNMTGDCFIDAFAYFDGQSRDAITWKRLRCELSDGMGKIADNATAGAVAAWAACFTLCGEDATLKTLHGRLAKASAFNGPFLLSFSSSSSFVAPFSSFATITAISDSFRAQHEKGQTTHV